MGSSLCFFSHAVVIVPAKCPWNLERCDVHDDIDDDDECGTAAQHVHQQ